MVLADAAYGNGMEFRTAITELELPYAVGIESSTTVWAPGQQPLPVPPPKARGRGAPPKRLQRNADHLPVSAKQLAFGLPSPAWMDIGWRQGSKGTLRSRFAAVRVRPAHRDYKRTAPHPEEWLLIEWPKKESEPAKYWLSTLPAKTSLKALVKIAKHRRIIERDYEELKQELGLGHYEGRKLARISSSQCHVVYRRLWVPGQRAELVFPPQPASAMLDYQPRTHRPDFRPRGIAASDPNGTNPPLDRDIEDRHGPVARRATASMSLLRITLRLIVGVDIHSDYTESGLGVIRCRSPPSPRSSLTSLSSSSAVHIASLAAIRRIETTRLAPPY